MTDCRVPIGGLHANYVFDPLDDITVFELAESMTLILVAPMTAITRRPQPWADIAFATLSEGARRHFKVFPLSKLVLPN